MSLAERASDTPERVGPYRIIEVLGHGGMGVVFRACHETRNETVALKTVLTPREYDVSGMRREIHALRGLVHPGVVRIVDEGIDAGVPWYAMELLEGKTLASYNGRLWRTRARPISDVQLTRIANQRQRRLDELSEPGADTRRDTTTHEIEWQRTEVACGQLGFALTVARRLCTTLAYVHGEGVVHRDLKAANVVLAEGDVPKIVDFGLVWRFPGATGREVLDDVAGSVAGTAGYMAPEQVRGEMVDARADLYSLGCVIYELLTGRLPFGGENAVEIRENHLKSEPIPPSLLVDGVPTALDDLVLKLLAKRPERRFGHADEVARVLASLGADASPWEATIRPKSYVYRPDIVGREEPLEIIDDHVNRTLRLQGGVVLISGESGIGKTYLAMAAARDAAACGVGVVPSACIPLGATETTTRDVRDQPRALPNDALLHPFRRVLLALVDRCLDSPDLANTLLGERAKVLAACEPSLATLPGLASHPEPEELPAQASRQRLLKALADTLSAFATTWPFVLLLDDLQWADELSLEFLASLPDDWFEEKGVLIVSTYRIDEESAAIRALAARPYVRRIALSRLPDESVGELVRGMLAIDAPPPGFVDLLARQSEGNPFFVAEYLRTAVAEQLLYRSPSGNWQIDSRLLENDTRATPIALPSSLQALIARRLDGLGEGARRILEVAAVLGREVDQDLLVSLAQLPQEEAWESTRELLARQILEEVDRGRLRFLHDKLREASYERIPIATRRALHRAAAHAIESRYLGSAELALHYAMLAHHHRQAEEMVEAIHYFELAGEQAVASFANREAIGHFGDAVAIDSNARADATWDERISLRERARLGGGNPARVANLRRARWERRLAEAQYSLGDLESVDRHVKRALEHTGNAPPSSQLGWASDLARNLPEQILHRLRPKSSNVRERVDQELLAEAATAMHHLAERSYYSFDALPMIAASLRSVNLAERAGIDVRVAAPYGMLGMTVGIGKLHRLGHRYFELARRAATATGDDAGLVFALYAKAAWRIGDAAWDEVRALCAEGAEIATRLRDAKALGMAQTLIAHADFYTGRFDESVRLYRELEETARRTGDRQHISWGLYAGARSRIPLGDLEQARDMLLESNEILEGLVEVPSKIICPGLLASVYVKLDDMNRALEAADLATARIRKNLPTVFATVAGYAGAAEAYLARWERLGRGREAAAARKIARRAVFDLFTLALNIPIGWPYYHRIKGEELRIDGKPRDARKSFEKGLAAAKKLGMRHDEAIAHLDLARIERPGTLARMDHLSRAKTMLEEMRCRRDLERLERVRRSREFEVK